MKTKLTLALVAFALMVAPGAAQNQTQQAQEISPGMVGPGSPFYGLETAWDNAAVSVGLKRAGNVAQERAAEVRQAVENNNTEGIQRATRNLERVADRARERDEEGINRAMQMMEQTMQNAPNEQARQGMQTALNNMREAQRNRQEARNQTQDREPGQPESGPQGEQGQQPQNTSETPEETGDRNDTEPVEETGVNETGQQPAR